MSDLISHSTDLLPQPQNLTITEPNWQSNESWQSFEFDSDNGQIARAWACSRREAQILLEEVPLPKGDGNEAYEALFSPDGMAVRARDQAGLICFDSLRSQMEQLSRSESGVPCCRISDWPDLGVRGIHLDLKYFMHRVDYLTDAWLAELHRFRINTLLLEYEDKFPFRRYPELAAPDAFTPAELTRFLARARGLGLRIIPLFQTLGHWEFILRHERFRSLRGGEDGEYHTEIRPNDQAALKLVFELIDEILAYHEEDDWFHAGGDEPWFLRKRYRNDSEALAATYGRHMRQVCQYLISKGKRPLIYEDIFRNIPEGGLDKVLQELPQSTILCFWDYGVSLSWPGPATLESLRLYRKHGFDVLGLACHNWGSIVPYYHEQTLRNTLEMLRVSREIGALGIINTTWACFRVPLPLSSLGVAVTGARSWKFSLNPKLMDIELAFSRLHFGLQDQRIVQALYQIGLQLEFNSNLGRPFNLPHFYYMDAVVQYGSHEQREKLGSSLDLYDNADCRYIVGRKLEMLRSSPQQINAIEALSKLDLLARAAEETLVSIGPDVSENQPLYHLILWAARFKQHAAQRMLALLGKGSALPEHLLAESEKLKASFRENTRWFLSEGDISRELAYLFEGEEALMVEEFQLTPI